MTSRMRRVISSERDSGKRGGEPWPVLASACCVTICSRLRKQSL
jgi:hypothetical protein